LRAALAMVIAATMAVTVSGVSRVDQSQSAQAKRPAASSPANKPWPDAAAMAERKREAERRRLFRSSDPFSMTLSADFRAVMRDRDPKSTATFPATISFPANDGSVASMPLRVRTRGYSRRNPVTCAFAPLRLEFETARTKGTIFDGHGALKLGTHCRKGAEAVILKEHVIYRMYNLLTPRSFRSRVVHVKYVDNGTQKTVAEEAGLLIEDDDDVAKRLEARSIELPQAIFVRVDQETLSLMMLFEYMIGNTDFSLMVQHNVRLMATQDFRRYPVPYDFDYSGLVDSGYGVPTKELGITDVRDRLYRGPCRTAAEWQPFLDKMRTHKAAFMSMWDTQPGLEPDDRRQAKRYLESFYKTIDNQYSLKEALIVPCVKIGM
jgi:hypothetical protein